MTTYRQRHLAGIHTDPTAETDTTVDELKTALKALNVSTTGNKTQLEKRLAKAQKDAQS